MKRCCRAAASAAAKAGGAAGTTAGPPARSRFRGRGAARGYVSVEDVQRKHSHLAQYAAQVEEFAEMGPSRRTVQQQLQYGREVLADPTKLQDSARYLQREMPVRLARSIRSFQNLPYIVGVNPRINDVYVKCWDWFVRLVEFTAVHGMVDSPEAEVRFTEHLLKVFEDHGNVLQNLRAGIAEVRAQPSSGTVDFEYVDKFLTSFVMRRISWRVLAETHIALKRPRSPTWVGVFNTVCSPAAIGADCFFQAQYLCESELNSAPEYAIKGDRDTTFEYIDAHLQYVLLELLKNSMRATVKFHGGKPGPLPKVVMRICHGDDITISLHDRGGGVSRELESRMWAYGFTTAREQEASASGQSAQAAHYFPSVAPRTLGPSLGDDSDQYRLAGWGFGLPMSRCYIEYLGGRLELRNMPGYGVDTVLTLPKLENELFRERFDFA